MAPDNDRLTQVEINIGVLQASQITMEKAITRMADSMSRLADYEAQREHDRETINRAFHSISLMDQKIDEHKESFDKYVLAQALEKNSIYKSSVGEFAKAILLVIAALFAGHFGGKLL